MPNSDLSSTVYVSGLSPDTTEKSLNEFFSFCGQIKSIDRVEKMNATIIFEKESAAKTSLMLDGGTLDSAVIQVTAATTDDPSGPNLPTSPTLADHEQLKQEDKPRSAIAAEYLAHGYILGDQAIAKAIALDQKHGISNRFTSYFQKIQERTKKVVPANAENSPTAPIVKNISSLVNWSQQYYEKALKSKQGSKVMEFYTSTSKQVLDVHSEARRIAEEKTGHSIFQFPCLNKNSSTSADTKQPGTSETHAVSQATSTTTTENEKN